MSLLPTAVLTTLVAALQATGLDTVLDDPDATFTVFAPTDAAFGLTCLAKKLLSALASMIQILCEEHSSVPRHSRK